MKQFLLTLCSIHWCLQDYNLRIILQQEAEDAAAAEEAALEGIGQFAIGRTGGEIVDHDVGSIIKSPSDFSSGSLELFVGQDKDDKNRDKMSIKSEGGESMSESKMRANGKGSKVRTVLLLFEITQITDYQKKIFSCIMWEIRQGRYLDLVLVMKMIF